MSKKGKRNRNGIGWKTAKQVFEKTGGKCFYCGVVLPPDTKLYDEQGIIFMDYRNWDIDHVIPHSQGGSDKIENLVPACKSCNNAKRAKSVDEFIAERFR